MNFDQKMMIGMLFKTHQHMTLNSPFIRHSIKNLDKINDNKLKVKEIIISFQNKEAFEKFANECLTELDKLNLAYGTAHYGCNFWVSIALISIVNDKSTMPNGCCAVENCTINTLYDIVSDKLIQMV